MTSEFSKPREDIVIAMRDQAVVSAVEKGFGVIIDDTNFEPKHKERIMTLIKHRKQTEFVEKFFDVPLSVCLERNRTRPNPVPDQVIIDMAKRYNIGKEVNQFEKIEMDPTLKMAIIVDIDGTVAEMWDRLHYDWSKVSEDKPHNDMLELVNVLGETYNIIFVSWRDGVCYNDTEDWLNGKVKHMYSLRMRPEGDTRKDSIVKYEILQEIVKEYFIPFVFDDRDQVVRMWREAGLRCLQVASGNF